MKNILIIFMFFLLKNSSYSQITPLDFGNKSISDVKNAFSINPCEDSEQMITYCVEDGSRLSFLFKSRMLTGIMTMTAFSSQYAAEKQLENEISLEKKNLGIEPFRTNGQTIFNTLDSPIFVSYGVDLVDKTYYLIHYVANK